LLKLKKLELFGFKSFCDKEELTFSGSGIASIVGPNGCGKSNVSDGISWVLGEQSAKTLRGARMQDVIFSGSRDRKPSGMATVSLTLYDPEARDGQPAADGTVNGLSYPAGKRPGEINVTRKLFSSGDSQYIINGRVSRLRDVHDLFMGTGLGPNHYAIIEQGRIGQVLSSKPLDRRAIIEEAAGVTKFKHRKRLAELKLESAKQNLNRVNDILQEVIRQVGSLKRQAAKARRYEELKKEFDAALGTMLATRHRKMSTDIATGEQSLEASDAAFQKHMARARTIEQSVDTQRQQEQRWSQQLDNSRQEHSMLTVESERCRSRVEQQARTAIENETRERHAEAEIQSLVQRIEQLELELIAEKEAVETVQKQSEEIGGLLAERNQSLSARQQEIAEVQRAQDQSRLRVMSLLGEMSSLRNQVGKIEEFQAGNTRQATRVEEEEAQARKEFEQVQSGRQERETRIEAKRQELTTMRTRESELAAALDDLKNESKARRESADALQHELSRLGARRESLQEILSHHAYTTETVKGLFGALQRRPQEGLKPMGVLADFIDVDREFERAAEDFLRDELEFVLVHDWHEARKGVDFLLSDLQGHATFLIHPDQPVPGEDPVLGPETGVTGRLADHVRLTNGLSASASTLLPKLRSCYLVEREDDANRLAVRYPDLYFLLPTGLCYRGHTVSGGRKSSAGPLALKRELRELTPKLAAAEQAFEQNRQAAVLAEESMTRTTSEREELRGAIQQAEKSVLAEEHDLQRVEQESERATRHADLAAQERQRLLREAAEAATKRAAIEQEIAQRERDSEAAEIESETLTGRMDASRAALQAASDEQSSLRTEAATLEERRRSASLALDRIRRLADEQTQRRERVKAQTSQWSEERLQLLADNEQLNVRIVELEAERKTTQENVATITTRLEESRLSSTQLEEEGRALRVEVEELRQQRNQLELSLVQNRSDLKHLEEMCERELRQPLAEVVAGVKADLSDEEVAEAEQNYLSLKTRIEALGPVNVLALEEYKEAEQRQEFLETQQSDLRDSISDTQKAIHEIDSASRKQFKEAFEVVNENFRKTFQTLFGGGVGEMRLTDEDNVGESGIDIVASPPGKKLQSVALLSGGEKSLTALALLVATFQYKPSPFCVLDEVDAALDESNIQRFRRLIESMSDRTQFILITHSKATMAAASTLYGVTMQEPGVSKLVSVRLDDERQRQLEINEPSIEPELVGA
jgi:chromosome segregation protein